jgi:hypothetical protein
MFKLLEHVRARAMWVLLRCCGIKCSPAEVDNRSYFAAELFRPFEIPSHVTRDAAVSLAKGLYDDENSRGRSLDDKAKTLLTGTSILFTLVGGLMALTAGYQDIYFRVLISIALALLFITVVLLVGLYFGINTFSRPLFYFRDDR